MVSVMMSRVPWPPASVPTSSLIRMITRRPCGALVRKSFAAIKMPSLIFVAPPALRELIAAAMLSLFLVSGTIICASVANVKSAT